MDAEKRRADDGLTDNYMRLARAVIAQACLDYLALRYPVTALPYLRVWYWEECGAAKGAGTDPPGAWLDGERYALSDFLNDGGGDLAQAAECYQYIRKVKYRYFVRGYRATRGFRSALGIMQNGFCTCPESGIE